MPAFDFKAARARRDELTRIYESDKELGDDLWAFALMAEIEEIDRDIQLAQQEIQERLRGTNVVIFPVRPQGGVAQHG